MYWQHCGRCSDEYSCIECPCSPTYKEWEEKKKEENEEEEN